MDFEEEDRLAMETATMILMNNDDVDIWDIPDWEAECKEDNDSSHSEEDDDPDMLDGEFLDQVDKLKAKIKNKTKLPKFKDEGQLDFGGLLIESEKRKGEVMNFEVGPAMRSSGKNVEAKKKLDLLDLSESYSENQTEFPWYSASDKEVA